MGNPQSFVTIIAQQPWFKKGTPAQRRLLFDAVSAQKARCRDRRERVKAHPDLADRLIKALSLSRFDQWTGYVPVARDEDGVPNDSPVRAELIAILREVVEREAAAAGQPVEEGVAEWE